MRSTLALLAAAVAPALALPTVSLTKVPAKRVFQRRVAKESLIDVQVAAQTAANAANGGFPEPSTYVDPLANLANCQRDLPNMQALGINTIRVYSINSADDHSGCMNLFNNAGIYVIADLSLPLNGSINRASPSWDTGLLDEYTKTFDNLAQYSNLLAVNIGNEVVVAANSSSAAPFVKAAARDIKAYAKAKNYTALVSYAAVDGDQWRNDLASYLNCGSEDISIDLYGLNNYRWCGTSTYQASGYATLVSQYQNLLNIPAYFSEFGCVEAGETRTWGEVASIFSTPMTNTFSGGVAFEYFADGQGFGMTANLTNPNATTITTNADFTNLATAFNAVPNTTAIPTTAQTAYPTCPTAPTATLQASSTLPPTPNEAVCNCFVANAFSCTVRSGASPVLIGSLLDYTCNALAQGGSSCAAIGANGTTGVYGQYSYCNAEQKLDAVFTAYYQLQNNNPQACSFSGNATVNSAINTGNASSAISQCQSGQQPTFVPSGVPAATAASTGAQAAVSTTATAKSGATSLQISAAAGLLGMAVLAIYA